MDKQTLRQIVIIETLLMVCLSLFFGYFMGTKQRQVYQKQNEINEMQNILNQLKYNRK